MQSPPSYEPFVQAFEAFLALPRERLLSELARAQTRRREQRCGTTLCLYANRFTIDESLPAGLSTHCARMIAVPFADTDDVEVLIAHLIQQVSLCLGDHFTMLWRSVSRDDGHRGGTVHQATEDSSVFAGATPVGEQGAGSIYLSTALLEKVCATWPHYSYRLTIQAVPLTRPDEVPPLDQVSEAFRVYSLIPRASGAAGDYRCIGIRGECFFVPRRPFELAFARTDAQASEEGYAVYTNRATHTVRAVQIPFPFLVQGTMGRKDRPGQATDYLFRTWFTTWDIMDAETFSHIYQYSVAALVGGEAGQRAIKEDTRYE
jgi:hypothetical protein